MAPRPPIQAVIEEQVELDTSRRNWRMVLFNEDGTPFEVGEGSGAIVEAWQSVTSFHAAWQDRSETPLKIRKDSLGKVTLRGAAEVVSVFSWGDRICTLPAGYRPAQKIELLLPYFEVTGSSRCIIWVDINTDGTVVPQYNPAGTVAGATDSRQLFDGVEFYID